jgi:hypothetical protein
MGFSISKLRQVLDNQTDFNVLVTILTDGEENASKEYSGSDIKKLIEELKLNRWTFTYIGADHDVEKFATSLSISNTMTFLKDEADMQKMFVSEMSARSRYSKKRSMNEATSDDFYETK